MSQQPKQLPAKAAIMFMDQFRSPLDKAIPTTLKGRLTYDSFRADVMVALRESEKLAACTPESIFSSVLFIARLGLSIGAHEGQSYLVPMGGKCTPLIGAQGRIELAYRSGRIRRIVTQIVHERDEFDVEYASGSVVHRPFLRGDPGPALFAWAGIWLTDQPDPIVEIMHRSQIDKIRSQSKSGDSPAWKHYFEEMWRRSCLNRALKRAPKSRDLAEQLGEIESVDLGAVVQADPRAGTIDLVDVPADPNEVDDIDARAAEAVGIPAAEATPAQAAPAAETTKRKAKAAPAVEPTTSDDDGGLG